MTKKIFITGISTDVGKTIAAAIVCESLQADYWKPIQAGDINQGDRHTVAQLLSNSFSTKSLICAINVSIALLKIEQFRIILLL